GAPGRGGALRLERAKDGLHLRFEGHALAARDGREHFRSERAQLLARVVPLSVDVRFLDDRDGFGVATGRVEVDGLVSEVGVRAFAGMPWAGSSREDRLPEVRLAAVAGGGQGLVLRVRGGRVEGLRHRGPGEPGDPVGGAAEGPGARPGAFSIDLGGASPRCEPRCHLSWLRSDADGHGSVVTVGVLACDLDGPGGGIFEHLGPAARPPGTREISGLPSDVKVP
ncbi:MAG: hypothetical protein ACKO2K_11505, partial [Alphaproteobacteria bacterium]